MLIFNSSIWQFSACLFGVCLMTAFEPSPDFHHTFILYTPIVFKIDPPPKYREEAGGIIVRGQKYEKIAQTNWGIKLKQILT